MPDICAETKKVIHSCRKKAEVALKALKEKMDYEGHVYPCICCMGFHFGREKIKSHKNKYKEKGVRRSNL